MKPVLFETKRIICRPLKLEDYKDLLLVYGDENAMKWVEDGKPITQEECIKWLEVTKKNYYIYGYGLSAIVERSQGEVIGFCGLVHPGGQKQTEIKYAFKRSYWGQGLATETVKSMLLYGSHTFNLNYIIATVARENIASQKVLIKSGMNLVETIINSDSSETLVFGWRKDKIKHELS